MWWGSPALQGLCRGELFSLLITDSHFALIHRLPHECKTPLPWLTEGNVNSCGAVYRGGEEQCFSGLKAALVSWDHGLIIAGGNLGLANVHLKSSAVRVLKHFKIILPTIFGRFYRLGLLSVEGGQSVSEGALEVKSESHISVWITSVCCSHWQFGEPLELKDVSFCITTNERSERKDKLLLGEI